MAAFFSFAGAVVGYFLGYGISLNILIPSIIFGLLFFFLSLRKKKALYYLIPLAIAIAVRLIPWQGKEGINEVEGIVVFTRNNYFILQSSWRRYYVYQKDCLYEVGDYLKLHGWSEKFLNTTYEGRFDFADYLAKKGVVTSFYLSKAETIFRMPIRLREMELSFLSHFSSSGQGLLDAILFNHKDLANEAVGLAASLGLLGVLSTSGLLYGSALRTIEKLLGLALSKKASCLITLGIGLCLLPFGISKIGLWRVFLTRLIRMFQMLFLPKKEYPTYAYTSLAGIFLLCLDYRLCYENGFLLGFGASFFFSFSSYLPKGGIKGKLSSSLLLFFFLLPSSLSMGSLHPFFLLFSLVLLPFSLLFSFFGFLSFFTVPFVGLLNGYASFLVSILNGLSHFDLAVSLPSISSIGIAFYYLFLILISLLREISLKKIQWILALGGVSIYAVNLAPIVPLMSSSVTFINVGQGDSTLIQDGSHAVLIDTGGVTSFDMAEEVLIPYLKKRRIYHIDAVIGTHGDFDHVGAVPSFLSSFSVGRYIDSEDGFPLRLGHFSLENLNHFTKQAKEENDASLVVYASLMGKKWLFMGDASIAVEKKILKEYPHLDCDILKLGHHGSNTSSSEEFLDQVTPDVAIISCGRKNQYGHPHQVILERLKKRGIKIRRTDLEGSIVYWGNNALNLFFG